jgi:TDG/mug DNA glycosylase family protein
MDHLPDIIAPNLRILFIGFNPGLRSAEVGHHFAGPSNRFWRLLHDSGLTERKMLPAEDGLLLALEYGLTNIVPRPTRAAAEITKQEYERGKDVLTTKLLHYKPQIACFVGIGVYREFSGRKNIKCGLQPISVVPPVLDFVVSSPSGLNTIPLDKQLFFFNELKLLAGKLAACRQT